MQMGKTSGLQQAKRFFVSAMTDPADRLFFAARRQHDVTDSQRFDSALTLYCADHRAAHIAGDHGDRD
jgi:hypothetical protein